MGFYATTNVYFGVKLEASKVSDETLEALDDKFQYIENPEVEDECFIGVRITELSSSIVHAELFKNIVINESFLAEVTQELEQLFGKKSQLYLNLSLG